MVYKKYKLIFFVFENMWIEYKVYLMIEIGIDLDDCLWDICRCFNLRDCVIDVYCNFELIWYI